METRGHWLKPEGTQGQGKGQREIHTQIRNTYISTHMHTPFYLANTRTHMHTDTSLFICLEEQIHAMPSFPHTHFVMNSHDFKVNSWWNPIRTLHQRTKKIWYQSFNTKLLLTEYTQLHWTVQSPQRNLVKSLEKDYRIIIGRMAPLITFCN